MKICSIHQPNFFPWLGFFDKIKRSDVFVLTDNVERTGGSSWINRVNLYFNGNKDFFTVPTKNKEDKIITKKFLHKNLPSFLNLEHELCKQTQEYTEKPWNEQNFLYELPRKFKFSLAIINQNTILGFCICYFKKIKNSFHISRFAVTKELQGKKEAEISIKFTYYILPYSPFYDIRSKKEMKNVLEIKSLGHDIGLHFNTDISCDIQDFSTLEAEALKQKSFLEDLLGFENTTFSYHNPTEFILQFKQEKFSGMQNAYNSILFSKYTYASDSNGYWRFKSIPEVLSSKEPFLYILTHPIWWNEKPMPPRIKIESLLLKNMQNILNEYDSIFDGLNRINYKK